MNPLCFAKLMKRLSLFVSRNAMNIDGISDAILSKLIDEGLIKSYYDVVEALFEPTEMVFHLFAFPYSISNIKKYHI